MAGETFEAGKIDGDTLWNVVQRDAQASQHPRTEDTSTLFRLCVLVLTKLITNFSSGTCHGALIIIFFLFRL